MVNVRVCSARVAALTALGILVASCGDSGGPSKAVLSTADAEALGEGFGEGLNTIMSSFTNAQIGIFPSPAAVAGLARSGGLARVPSVLRPLATGCPTFTGDDSDLDLDGIPLNLTYTYTAANCTTTDVDGTQVVTGAVTISDQGFGYRILVGELRVAFTDATDPANNASLSISGSHSFAGDATGAAVSQAFTTSLTLGIHSASISNVLHVAFSPDGAGEIVPGVPLPDGVFSMTGSAEFTGEGKHFAFAFSTPTGLSYDSSCVSEPQLTEGVVQATLTGSGGDVYVQITYGPTCGQVVVHAVGTAA